MLRVFHIPAHLDYVSKLTSPHFQPAPSPSPTGSPLTAAALLAVPCWGFFDVLHLHTVELASRHELDQLFRRAAAEGKRVVFTVHDLVPAIETDLAAFDRKTRLAAQGAHSLLTLTHAAARQISDRFGRTPKVVPHGYVLPPGAAATARAERGHRGSRIVAFGALRPNRSFTGLTRAWSLLPQTRPPLEILVRSVRPADLARNRETLAALENMAAAHEGLRLRTVDRMLSEPEITELLADCRTLVLPYKTITHSGQLELARDLGLGVLAPAFPTLRAQLDEAESLLTATWFDPQDLEDPPRLAERLRQACSAAESTQIPERADEHARLLETHHIEYCFS